MGVSFAEIVQGQAYSRQQLARLWGYSGAEAISRGVVTPRDDNKIILFVTLDKLTRSDPYDNHWSGGILLWEGPNDHYAEARMLGHRDNGDEIHLFLRHNDRDSFTYGGQLDLYCCQQLQDRPSRFAFLLRREPGDSVAG